MKELEKSVIDKKIGVKYELKGDYYPAGNDIPEEHRPIGVWGQRHFQYLKQNKKGFYSALLIEGKLLDYLVDVNMQAEEMLFQLVKQMAKKEGITEEMKRLDQMTWVGAMNNVRNRAEEIVLNELIFQ